MVEYEFSAWYFLFFTLFYKNSTQETKTVDMSLLVPELSRALATKLTVPASVFNIAKAEKYRSVVSDFSILLSGMFYIQPAGASPMTRLWT